MQIAKRSERNVGSRSVQYRGTVHLSLLVSVGHKFMKCAELFKYEGKSVDNRNFILKCMEKYAQRKILFGDTKWLLSDVSYRGRDDQAV